MMATLYPPANGCETLVASVDTPRASDFITTGQNGKKKGVKLCFFIIGE